jgi:hypothetical protein
VRAAWSMERFQDLLSSIESRNRIKDEDQNDDEEEIGTELFRVQGSVIPSFVFLLLPL